MRTGLNIATLLLLLATLGCRSQGELDLAERDLRLQENRIYKLQDYVHQYQQMLEDCHAENEELRRQLAEAGRTPVAPRSDKPRTLRELMRGDSGSSASRSSAPTPSGPDLTLPVTPSIDLGQEVDPDQVLPGDAPTTTPAPSAKPPAENDPPTAPGFSPAPAQNELPEPDELPNPAGASSNGPRLSSLAIRAIGQVRGNQNTAGGLLVVVEPRSAAGGITRAPQRAKMSLLLVTGPEEQSLGRWDYTEEETAAAYRTAFGAASSWRFILPFATTDGTPNKLKIYVRLTMPDGTKLISEREFDTDAGAAIEELPSGNAGWSRASHPLAAISNFFSGEGRVASRLGNSNRSGNQGSTRGSPSRGGNQAPAWQLQPLQPPAVSSGPPDNSLGSAAASGSAPGWDASRREIPAPEKQPESNSAPVAETATRAAESSRPTWSPYR